MEVYHQLQQLYQTDKEFRAEMDENQRSYNLIINKYTAQSESNLHLIDHYVSGPANIYLFYGCKQQLAQNKSHQLIANFFPKFRPNLPYTFVYCNQATAYSKTFCTFKKAFLCLPLQHFCLLREFILLKPDLYHKTIEKVFSFGPLNNYLYRNYKAIENLAELFYEKQVDRDMVLGLMPKQVYSDEFPQKMFKSITMQEKRYNVSKHMLNSEEYEQQLKFQKTIDQLFLQKNNQPLELDEYDKNQNGIPIVLEMLIQYFQQYPEGLKVEGLFRKSVNIDEQREVLNELYYKNYKSLQKVSDPHLISNLLKRFFSKLKTPIIPYDIFNSLMHDQGVSDKFWLLKDKIKQLHKLNYLCLMTLIEFLVLKVQPNQLYNKMSHHNLAICFSPCILRSKDPSMADMIYAGKAVTIVENMLTRFNELFGKAEERMRVRQLSYQEERRSFRNSFQNTMRKAK